MDIRRLVAVVWFFKPHVEGRAGIGQFLTSFVDNERKPAMVVFHGICWNNTVKLHVMKELSKAGIRSSNFISKRTSFIDHTVLLLADLNCPGTDKLIMNTTQRELHRLPYRWLVLSDAPQPLLASLWDQFLVDSELVLATVDGAGYTMTEVYKPSPTSPAILTPRGTFQHVLTDTRPHRELFRRRRDLMGVPLTITNTIQESNSSIYHLLQEDSLELQLDLISKNSYTLAKVAFLSLNATPVATFTNSFGYLQDGQWNGVIRELLEYNADIGTNVGMTTSRLQQVMFLDPLDNGRARFIFRQPALSLTANIFSLPFSPGVWMATGISSFVAGVAYYLSTKLIKTRAEQGTVRDAYLLTMSALSQQGCEVQPRHVSARIVLWVVFTSMMALFAAYGANIVVLLQAPSTSVNSLATLAKSKLALGAADVNYNHFLFRASSDPVRNDIARRVNSDKGPKAFYGLTEGVEKIRKSLFAFHSVVEPVYRQIDKTFQEKEKCDLMELDYIGYAAFHVPGSKKSPYLELLRVTFKRLREVGIKSAVNFRYEARRPSCKESVAMFSSVGITEMRPVLIFMAYGVALSVAVTAAELLVFHAYRYRLRQQRRAEGLARRI
ncbi:glutamate receptor ionotropic, kainate 2-like [Cydia fagiglandana]|uniref:glutamate receptor ionotropic, kainate 2-like n=1 Tax=Cydia fagiglandana TaxID=1458189 RepID=UPI002FEDEBBD